MIKYPLSFQVRGEASSNFEQPWTGTAFESSPESVRFAVPPQFDGAGGGLSPEDAYALALQNCFVATFKVMAHKSNLAFEKIETTGTLTVDRDDQGAPWMSKFDLDVRLFGPAKPDLANRLLERTRANCLILNSVRTDCTVKFQIAEAAATAQV